MASRELAGPSLPTELSEGLGQRGVEGRASRSGRGLCFLNRCVLGKVLKELGLHPGPGEGGQGGRESLAGALSHLGFL